MALHSAAQCPEKTGTLILGGSQFGLQIHESVGHPIELDRVLGQEANFAGTSFLTLDKLNHLRYASPIVNVVADARIRARAGARHVCLRRRRRARAVHRHHQGRRSSAAIFPAAKPLI